MIFILFKCSTAVLVKMTCVAQKEDSPKPVIALVAAAVSDETADHSEGDEDQEVLAHVFAHLVIPIRPVVAAFQTQSFK